MNITSTTTATITKSFMRMNHSKRMLLATSTSSKAPSRNIFGKIKNFFMPSPFVHKEEGERIAKLLKSRAMPTQGDQCLFAFGEGRNGRLGLNSTDQTTIPMPILFQEFQKKKIVKFVTGAGHFMVLLEDGRVYSCGNNEAGQLGVGDTDDALAPILVKQLENEKIVDIAAGYTTSAAVTEDGRLYTWGFHRAGFVDKNTITGSVSPLGYIESRGNTAPRLVEALQGEKVTHVSLGETHSGCLTEKGEVFTFGTGNWGRLGHGDSRSYVEPKKLDFNHVVRALSLGKGSTHMLTDNGTLWAFGKSDNGSLGMDTSSLLSANQLDGEVSPVLIEPLQDMKVVHIACGGNYSTAIDSNGTPYIWGKNYFEATSLRFSNVVDSAAGINHTGYVDDKGHIYMTGSSMKGQMAREGSVMDSLNETHAVNPAYFPGKVTKIACGEHYTLALVDLHEEAKKDQEEQQEQQKKGEETEE